jgi:hypothetical protein
MRQTKLGAAILLLVAGCAAAPTNDYSGTVKPGTRSEYVTYFKWTPVYALDRDRQKAIQTMLEKSALTPKECTRGITFIRGGEAEGGWGWAQSSGSGLA